MRRQYPVAILIAAALLVPLGALAAPTPPPTPSAAPGPSSEPQNGGIVEGTVIAVDYQRGTLNVGTAHGDVLVYVMPSTSVQSSDPGYHAFSDVAKGAKVQIFTSKIGGRYVAQIIRILKR